jgi:hypothetical protein
MPSIPAGQPTAPFDRAVEKCSDLAWQIVKCPADTVDEMLLKIEIAAWCAGVSQKTLPNWQADDIDSEELHALASLRDDLRRLPAA